MSKIDPKSIPSGVTNAVQAFALDLAGAAPAEQPCVVIYDADLLFRLGGGEKDNDGKVTRPSRFAGMDIVEAAKAAHGEGLQGRVTYRFNQANNFGSLCRAFSDQEQKLSSSNKKKGAKLDTAKEAIAIATAMVNGEMDHAEGIVRLSCLILKTYIPYKNQWKKITPMVKVDNPGETTTTPSPGGGKVVKSPGWRIMSVNASPETRRKLKI